MASLEAAVFPPDPLGYCSGRELYGVLGDGGCGWSSGFFDDFDLGKMGQLDFDDLVDGSSGDLAATVVMCTRPCPNYYSCSPTRMEAGLVGERSKRRRGKSRKNKEKMENQRMKHIAVERNRRKQMNEYLSVLRSMVPESYVQRGDQASIIGGAINFLKELEQQVHLFDARKQSDQNHRQGLPSAPLPTPFADCFSLPQYPSTTATASPESRHDSEAPQTNEVADIEVKMVESHVDLKIRSRRRPKQLLRLVSGLQAQQLTVLHLNVSTADQIVLYSLSLKVEEDYRVKSVDEMASAVHKILVEIQEEKASV
ncbi:hypothetical protein SAY87_032125 [Trapa incisa]|uniref:BHLH domain-containing protein n=1 Tax=Trapa incisa TaxID=236973 RepID=A0AAN7KW98_9MYRT|nr:hypothetical protein SAY87_032125 [Trapa incisa]